MKATFVELYISGDIEAQKIDRFVAEWHEGDSEETLAAYLGFTEDEYARWVERPESLHSILRAKKFALPPQQVRYDSVR